MALFAFLLAWAVWSALLTTLVVAYVPESRFNAENRLVRWLLCWQMAPTALTILTMEGHYASVEGYTKFLFTGEDNYL